LKSSVTSAVMTATGTLSIIVRRRVISFFFAEMSEANLTTFTGWPFASRIGL
jgi:hypothetical protein